MDAHAYSVLDSYLYRFAQNEKTHPFDRSPEKIAEVAASIMREMPPGEYPYLTEIEVEHAMKTGYDYGDEFEFGLKLILEVYMLSYWETSLMFTAFLHYASF